MGLIPFYLSACEVIEKTEGQDVRAFHASAISLVSLGWAVGGCGSSINRGVLEVGPVEDQSAEVRALAVDCGVVRHAFRYEYTGPPARLVVTFEARQRKEGGKHLETSVEELLMAEGGAGWVRRNGMISVSYVDPISLPTPNALLATLQVNRVFRRMRLRVPALLSTPPFPSYADGTRQFLVGNRNQLWSYYFFAFPEKEQDRSSRSWDHNGETVTITVMIEVVPVDPGMPILPLPPSSAPGVIDTQPVQE